MAKKINKKKKTTLNYKFKENKKRTFLGLVLILIIAFAGVKILFLSSAATVSTYSGYPPVGIAASGNSNDGYWVAAKDGGVFSQGTAVFRGSMGGQPLSAPIVGIAANPLRTGYYLVGADGAVYAFNAPYHGGVNNAGSGGGTALIPGNRIVGMAVDPANGGYDLVDNQGHIYGFGGAPYFDVISYASSANEQIASISFSPSGNGFYALTKDGRVLSYGDVAGQGGYLSGLVGSPVSISGQPGTNGFVITTSSGCAYAYNGGQYYGGMCGVALNGPIVGITSTSDGKGYWMVASDGGVFTFGDAQFQGAIAVPPPTAAPAPTPAPAPAPKPGSTTPTAPATAPGTPPSTGVTQAQCDALKGVYSDPGKCACVYGSGPNDFGICTSNDVLNYNANHGIVGDTNQPVLPTGPLSCPKNASASSTGCNCNLGFSSGYGGACVSLYLIDTYGHGCMNGFSWSKPAGQGQGFCDSGNLSAGAEKILADATGVKIDKVGTNSYSYTCLAVYLCKN